MNIDQIAMAVTLALAPFTPFLTQAGTEGSKRLGEIIAQKGGEAAWEKSRDLWQIIRNRFRDDPKVEKVAELVALDPDDSKNHEILSQLLAKRMQSDPEFANVLLDTLGGSEVALRIIATNDSHITNVRQSYEGDSGTSEQIIQADHKSTVDGATQSIKINRFPL